MKKLFCVTAVSLLWLNAGCGLIPSKGAASAERQTSKKPSAESTDPGTRKRSKAIAGLKGDSADEQATPRRSQDLAKPRAGDFFVHRFSGSFARTPLILTEQVVEVENDQVTVDYTLEEPPNITKLRAVFTAETRELLSLSRFAGAEERPVPHETLDQLLAKTAFRTDLNQDLTDAKDETCLVGLEEHSCETKTYRVRIGEADAILSVTSSPAFPDRDLSGEIRSSQGELLYRAELVEAGGDTKEPSLALGE